MNNALYRHVIRWMDKQIERDIAETIDVVKNGYRCESNCVLRKQGLCKGVGGLCKWDLRSGFWEQSKRDRIVIMLNNTLTNNEIEI